MKRLLSALLLAGFSSMLSAQAPLWDLAKDKIPEALNHGAVQQADGSVLEIYGAASALFGTAATSIIAVLFAAPIGILGAVYLVEFAPRAQRAVDRE